MLLQASVTADSMVQIEYWRFRMVMTRLGSTLCNNKKVPKLKAGERKVRAGVTNIFACHLER